MQPDVDSARVVMNFEFPPAKPTGLGEVVSGEVLDRQHVEVDMQPELAPAACEKLQRAVGFGSQCRRRQIRVAPKEHSAFQCRCPGYVVGAEPEDKRDLTIGSLPVWRIAQRVSVLMPVNEQQGDLAETRPGGGKRPEERSTVRRSGAAGAAQPMHNGVSQPLNERDQGGLVEQPRVRRSFGDRRRQPEIARVSHKPNSTESIHQPLRPQHISP